MAGRPILARYLARHALVDNIPRLTRGYDYLLTIPAYDEPVDFLGSVLRHHTDTSVLSLVVVNAPEGAAGDAVRRTRNLSRALCDQPDVLVIERLDPPLPKQQGVGLARRLAGDLACALIQQGAARHPILFMTDADVVLPPEYFQAADGLQSGSLLYPFEHRSTDPATESAAVLYELHLRHYVRGLVKSGSPYAFPALGSTIAVHADTYAKVRGVPRRNAAEDFYLLNKAAKVDPVFCPDAPTITIQARMSHRVPFGTGPALQNLPADPDTFTSYPMAAFDALAAVQDALTRFALHDRPPSWTGPAATALIDLDWQMDRFRLRYPPGRQRLRAVLEWFDGFRTMRFVRLLQNELPAATLLNELRVDLAMPGALPDELLSALRSARHPHRCGLGPALEEASTKYQSSN